MTKNRVEYKDLREWIEKVKALKELTPINGAKLEEIGPILELNAMRFGPALLFDNIKGYSKGFRVLCGALLNSHRVAMTFGFPADLNTHQLMDALTENLGKWEKDARSAKYPPEEVSNGPIFENVKRGKDVDMMVFPVPKWHDLDGGPYIGTADLAITKDPLSDWVNFGCYRTQILDKNHVSNHIEGGHHGAIIRDRYFEKGKPLPIVMSFSQDPLLFLAAGIEIPYGVSEYNWAGAVRGESTPVVRGKVTGLPIPVYSEIAVEGFVYKDQKRTEGPFGEFTGYYGAGARPEYFFKVEALYHRNDPILLVSPAGKPYACDKTFYYSLMRSVLLQQQLTVSGVPNVKRVWCTFPGGGRMFNVVSIKQAFPGHAKQAALLASQLQVGGYMAKLTIVVDEDVDPTNLNEVMWATVSRMEAAEDVEILKKCWSSELDPRIPPEKKERGELENSRLVINACRPYDWKDKYPAVCTTDPAILQKVKAKYKAFFPE